MSLTFLAAGLLIVAATGDVAPLGTYTAAERRHWAFQPVKDPAPPVFADAGARSGFTEAFAALKAKARSWILFRLQTSKKPETRARQLAHFLAKLAA